jgi:WD40-like Beta Propeller Repeat
MPRSTSLSFSRRRSRLRRRAAALLGLSLAVVGCGEVASSVPDAAPDARTGCDPSQPFGTPELVLGLDSPATEISVWLTEDERTAYVTSDRAGSRDLYVASRVDRDAAFSALTALTVLNSAVDESGAALSRDGLTLVFARQVGMTSQYDLFVTTRSSPSAAFGAATPLAVINDAASDDYDPALSPDGSVLYFTSLRSGSSDLFLATRNDAGDFVAAQPLLELNTPDAVEGNPFVSADALQVVFNRFTAGASVWTAVRSDPRRPFASPAPLPGAVGSSKWLSPDGCRLYVATSSPGSNADIYVQRRR